MEKKERNLEIAKKILSLQGQPSISVSAKYGVGEARGLQMVWRFINAFLKIQRKTKKWRDRKVQEGRRLSYYQAKWRNGDFAQE